MAALLLCGLVRRDDAVIRAALIGTILVAIGSAVHPTRVIGIALNTFDLDEAEARRACEAAARETGLPATDPVRFDPAPLVDAIVDARSRHAGTKRRLQ